MDNRANINTDSWILCSFVFRGRAERSECPSWTVSIKKERDEIRYVI